VRVGGDGATDERGAEYRAAAVANDCEAVVESGGARCGRVCEGDRVCEDSNHVHVRTLTQVAVSYISETEFLE